MRQHCPRAKQPMRRQWKMAPSLARSTEIELARLVPRPQPGDSMNRHSQFIFKLCRACFPGAIGLMLSLGSTMHAHASAPNASQAATKYVECGKPLLRENSPRASLGKAGFRIDVNGESYFFDTDERILISFDSSDSKKAEPRLRCVADVSLNLVSMTTRSLPLVRPPASKTTGCAGEKSC